MRLLPSQSRGLLYWILGVVGAVAILWLIVRSNRRFERVSLDAFPAVIDGYTVHDLGIKEVRPQLDSTTGFQIGGVNQSELISTLTSINGHSIAKLESRMRPVESEIYDPTNENIDEAQGPIFEGSMAGFLGETESLIDVMFDDNRRVVDEWGLTHQDLARPLLLFAYYAKLKQIRPITVQYGPFHFRIDYFEWRGSQYSPFLDNTSTYTDVIVQNVDTGASLRYSLLVPVMIERNGFYEGHGTKYRVSPDSIFELLHLKPNSLSPSSTVHR